MGKIDAFKILGIVLKGMEIIQKVSDGKSKQQKIDAAIDESTDILGITELVANKDLLRDERLKPFLEKYMSASKDLVNKIHELRSDATGLKP